MDSGIIFYPTLTQSMKKSINSAVTYAFSFVNSQNEIVPIDVSFDGSALFLDIEKSSWNFSEFDLILTVGVTIEQAKILYGENGIAPASSKICIGLEHFSQKDRKRGVVLPQNTKCLQNSDSKQHFFLCCKFPKGSYENSIQLNLFLFLYESARSPASSEVMLNNQVGVDLGTIETKEISLNPKKSQFPIYFDDYPCDNRLWYVEIDYEDPFVDDFYDCFKIHFNTKHKDFQYVQNSSEASNQRIVCEIVSSSITTLINQLRNEKWFEQSETDFLPGSIMDFIHYMKDLEGLENLIKDSPVELISILSEFLRG